MKGMGSINNLSSSYLQSAFSTALQGTALTAGTSTSGVSSLSDEGQLSPVAQVIGTLQQLQQSNPAEFHQVIQQIAANLESAAQTAQNDGDVARSAQPARGGFSQRVLQWPAPSLQEPQLRRSVAITITTPTRRWGRIDGQCHSE